MRTVGEVPFRLDSPRPHIPLKDYVYNEVRYSSLVKTRPTEAAAVLGGGAENSGRQIPRV